VRSAMRSEHVDTVPILPALGGEKTGSRTRLRGGTGGPGPPFHWCQWSYPLALNSIELIAALVAAAPQKSRVKAPSADLVSAAHRVH